MARWGAILMMLTEQQRVRLSRLCGMFGSQFEGERATAAAMADKLLKESGLTWSDVLSQPQPQEEPRAQKDRSQHQAMAAWILANKRTFLSDWEISFLNSLVHWKTLSAKQKAVFDRIFDKVASAP